MVVRAVALGVLAAAGFPFKARRACGPGRPAAAFLPLRFAVASLRDGAKRFRRRLRTSYNTDFSAVELAKPPAGDGPQRIELEQSIHGLGLRDQFQLPGPVSDVPAFLAGIDIAVLPSRAEGMSNALLEFMAAGRPVVTENLAAETRFVPPQMHRDHGVVSGVTAPIAGSDGRAYGVVGAHTTKRRKFVEYEILFLNAVANVVAGAIQRQQADQRQHLMIRELRHRSGNLFSQLLALFSQTAKNSRNVAELAIKYEARVLALALYKQHPNANFL